MGIDESLYSRQLYAIGAQAMDALDKSSVLISGMTGIGVEIAKCVILSGVKNVTLHDSNNIRKKDLSSNYYASLSDVGKNRADTVKEKLSSLNSYVTVTSIKTPFLTDEHFKMNNVVVICDQFSELQINANKIARKYGTKFILASTIGLLGQIFCDFGDNFHSNDLDGESPKSGIITNVDGDKIITAEPHQLYFGDTIEIKNSEKVLFLGEVGSVKNTVTFTIKGGNITKFDNATFTQIKKPVEIKFKQLSESIIDPEFAMIIQNDFERQMLLHNFTKILYNFVNQNGKLPTTESDHEMMVALSCLSDKNLSTSEIRKLSQTCAQKFCPIDSIIGGIVGQEVIKAITYKFTPIKQWLYIDYIQNIDPEVMNSLPNQNVFIVGAGAIGCELLKNLAMIGVGNITITDMDIIEKSNLNRQFLFRYDDIGKFKSECAAKAINVMNPNIKITAQKNKVSSDTENIYNKDFFSKISCVMAALDNVQARSYVDELCVKYCKPLIDSGTLGTKANVQTIIPHLTESYRSTQDPPEKDIPMCTLKNFPYLIDHTIQWARNLFEGIFVKAPQNFILYKNNPEKVKMMNPSELSEIHDDILFVFENSVCHQNECIDFAYKLWHEHFRDQIYHLINKFPEDLVSQEGGKFWSGTKKFPKVLKFEENDVCMAFLESTANLWADVFKIKHLTRVQIKKFLSKKNPPKIKKLKEDIVIDDKEKKSPKISKNLPSKSDIDDINVIPLEFEKDNDSNFHIDFITCASNLRAENYGIPVADKFKTKGIAGKIIPALVTTTSLVAGLATMELLKTINKNYGLENFTESFINLATPFISFSIPKKVINKKVGSYKYTIWDHMVFGDITLKDLIEELNKKINDVNIYVSSISSGKYMLYSEIDKLNNKKYKMKLSDIYKNVSEIKDPNSFQICIFTDNINDDNNGENNVFDYDEILCTINVCS